MVKIFIFWSCSVFRISGLWLCTSSLCFLYIYIYIYIYIIVLSQRYLSLVCSKSTKTNAIFTKQKWIMKETLISFKKVSWYCHCVRLHSFFKILNWIGYEVKLCAVVSLPSINHHHHVVLLARISLTLSHHFSLSFIASGRSSGLHSVSSHSCWMYVPDSIEAHPATGKEDQSIVLFQQFLVSASC